ncbi:hypothetical protein GW17_00008372, partial [Ensete ventricosum]
ILDRKEYFGQYGKVVKVSISRPASTPTQQASSNGTCSQSISSQAKGSPPDSNAGKPIVLPAGASWCDACCSLLFRIFPI